MLPELLKNGPILSHVFHTLILFWSYSQKRKSKYGKLFINFDFLRFLAVYTSSVCQTINDLLTVWTWLIYCWTDFLIDYCRANHSNGWWTDWLALWLIIKLTSVLFECLIDWWTDCLIVLTESVTDWIVDWLMNYTCSILFLQRVALVHSYDKG